jgi:hypothetical protein
MANKIMDKVGKKLDLKVMGPVNKFLGMNFTRIKKYMLNIDLTNYILSIIKRFNKETIRYVDTPIALGLKLRKATVELIKANILIF